MYRFFIVFFFICHTAVSQKNSGDDSTFLSMMAKCQRFVENYKPSYINGSDTLLVSMIAMPPDDINKFIFNCIENGNYKPMKYCAVIFMKQNEEYKKVNHEDYKVDDTSYARNGFIEMVRVAMNLRDPIIGREYPMSSLTTGDVCKWIFEKKNKIDDFQYVISSGL